MNTESSELGWDEPMRLRAKNGKEQGMTRCKEPSHDRQRQRQRRRRLARANPWALKNNIPLSEQVQSTKMTEI
jgi:hypothetical protein